MAFLTSYGTPFREGMHNAIFRFCPVFPFIAGLFCIPLVLLPVSPFKPARAAVIIMAVRLHSGYLSRKLFGGMNGDVVGASNEITRACVIVALALI